MEHRWRHPPGVTFAGAGRIAHALLFGAVTAIAGGLPGWLHGAHTFEAWNLLGAVAATGIALALAGAGAVPCSERRALLVCVGATCLGMTLDFWRIAPQALASLCSSDPTAGWGLGAISAHLRLFPATSVGMLLVVLQRGGLLAWPASARAMSTWPQLLLGLGAMLALMALAMQAFRLLAWEMGWNWGAHGMVCAMIVSMFIYLLASHSCEQAWRRMRPAR